MRTRNMNRADTMQEIWPTPRRDKYVPTKIMFSNGVNQCLKMVVSKVPADASNLN